MIEIAENIEKDMKSEQGKKLLQNFSSEENKA